MMNMALSCTHTTTLLVLAVATLAVTGTQASAHSHNGTVYNIGVGTIWITVKSCPTSSLANGTTPEAMTPTLSLFES